MDSFARPASTRAIAQSRQMVLLHLTGQYQQVYLVQQKDILKIIKDLMVILRQVVKVRGQQVQEEQ